MSEQPMFDPMAGTRVRVTPFLTEAGEPYQARRSWTERFLSWPWRPWQATKTVVPQVPMKGGYRLSDGTMLMHPETWRTLSEQLRKSR